mgnify:CR=1 FL=1
MAQNNKVVVKFIADTAQMRKSLGSIDGSLKKFGKSALALGGILAGAFAAKVLVDFGKAAVDAASAFEETGSKIANIFGPGGSADLQEWADSAATSFGLSSQAALDAASTFGIYADKAGIAGKEQADFATGLTELSSDLASFYDANQDQVINALQQGLRGETEALRKYGVFLDDAAYKQGYFNATGETLNGTLTAQQKIIGGQQQIWEQAGVAIGDFEATSDGLANTTRSLGAVLEDTKRKFGEGLLPVINELAQTLLPVLETLQPVIQQLGKDIGEALGPVLQELGKVIGPVAQQFGVIAKLISGLLSIALKAIAPILGIIVELFGVFASRVAPILNRVMEKLGALITKVYEALMPLTEVIFVLVAELLEGLEPAFDLVVEILIILIDALIPIIKAFADIALAIMPLISAVLPLLISGIKLVVMAFEPVVKLLSVYLTKAIGYYILAMVKGSDAMRGFSEAVLRGLVKPLQIALGVVADFVEGFSSIPGIGSKFGEAADNIRGFAGGIEGSVESLINTSREVSAELGKVGQGLVDGFEEAAPAVNGVLDTMTIIPPATTTRAVAAATEVGEEVGGAIGKGASSAAVTKSNTSSMVDSIKTTLEAAAQVFEDWRGKVVGWLDIGSAFNEANDAKATLSDLNNDLTKLRLKPDYDKSAEADLLDQIDKAGAEAGKSWSQRFADSIGDGVAFAKQLGELKNSNLNQILLEQIAAMGPETGGQLATELLGDKGLIGEINAQSALLNQAGVDLGLEIVNSAPSSGKKYGMAFLYDEEKGLVATINAQSKKVKKKIKESLDTSVSVRVVYSADYSNAGPAYNGSGGFSNTPVRQIREYERLNGTSWRK